MEFLAAFEKLAAQSPRPAAYNFRDRDCTNCNFLIDSVNSHFCFNSGDLINCAYCDTSNHCRDSLDLDNCEEAENCFECSDSSGIKNCRYLINCFACSDCELSEDLFGCSHCFGCVGLFKKQFHIFNKNYDNFRSYARKLAEIRAQMSKEEILRSLKPLRENRPRLNMLTIDSPECYGDYVFDSKVSQNCFNVSDTHLSSYIFDSQQVYFSADCNNCYDISNCYDCVECSQLHYGFHCFFVSASRYLTLCAHCFNCTDCLGCVNLKNKSFHILNVPYEEKEYRKRAALIINDLRKNGNIFLSQYFTVGA